MGSLRRFKPVTQVTLTLPFTKGYVRVSPDATHCIHGTRIAPGPGHQPCRECLFVWDQAMSQSISANT